MTQPEHRASVLSLIPLELARNGHFDKALRFIDENMRGEYSIEGSLIGVIEQQANFGK
jgi:hypothetical protein